MRIFKKGYFSLYIILSVHLLLIIYIKSYLEPIYLGPQNLLFLELTGVKFSMPYGLLTILDLANLILLWAIGKKFLGNFHLIPPIIYAIIPWSTYLAALGSLYIYFLFLVLSFFYFLILFKSDQKFLWLILAVICSALALYGSIIFIFFPILYILSTIFKILPFKSLRIYLSILAILVFPLLFAIYKNQTGFESVLKKEIGIFSDPGLLNNVNSYRGEASEEKVEILAKFSENKYLFSIEYTLLKFAKQITPSTYFSQQEKLLTFSFSTPIYFGFLFPFVYGLFLALRSKFVRKILLLSTLLLTPSILAKDPVELSSLIIFSPVVILIISYGLSQMFKKRKSKLSLFFLTLSLILVIFQFAITLYDIRFREKERFVRYHGENFEIRL